MTDSHITIYTNATDSRSPSQIWRENSPYIGIIVMYGELEVTTASDIYRLNDCSAVFIKTTPGTSFTMKSANAVVWQLDTDKLPDYPFDTKLTLDETAATVIHNVFFEHKRSIALQTAALQFVCLQLQQTHAESQQIQLPLPLTDHDKEQTLVTLIINYLQSHLDESVTIDKLAEQFKCGKSDITKSFRDERGKTPTQVLIQLRVKHAKDLLQNSDRTISQIAYACGYQDLAGFSHFFKKQTAQSPSEFRDNCHWLV